MGVSEQRIRCLSVRILFIVIKDNNCSETVCVGHVRVKEDGKLGPQVYRCSHERRMMHICWPSPYKNPAGNGSELNQIEISLFT